MIFYNIIGIQVKRYDFSESQDGKSYCDAKIAHMRAKLRKFVANGGNIVSAADMKKSLDEGEGVPGCQIAHIEITSSDQIVLQHKIKGITKIFNIEYVSHNTIKYWRNYEVGDGQTMSIVPFDLGSTLSVVSDFKKPKQHNGHISYTNSTESLQAGNTTLTCPEQECSAVIHSYSEFNDHMFVGNHSLSTYDDIKIRWLETCQDLATFTNKSKESILSSGNGQLDMGWAQKKERKGVRFSERVKVYLKKVFEDGEKSGNKANATNVARHMRVCCNDNGCRLFAPKDYLQPSQITSYFSRLAVQSRNLSSSPTDDDIDSTIALINKVEALEELRLSEIF